MLDDLVPIIFNCDSAEGITVYPISDLHYGSPTFMQREWDDFCQSIMNSKNNYIFIAGDMIDNGLKNSLTNVYQQTASPSQQKKWLASQLKPLAPRIICGCGGNHERRSLKEVDDSPLYDVFCKLDIEDRFRENSCFLIMRFGITDEGNKVTSHGRRFDYNGLVTHGSGGGMYIASSANRIERYSMSIEGLDFMVTGHTHKPLNFPVGKLVIDNRHEKITQRQLMCVTATSWLNYGGYPIQKLMTPTAHTLTEMHFSGKERLIRVTQ